MLPALACKEVDRQNAEIHDAQFKLINTTLYFLDEIQVRNLIILDVDSENEKVKNVLKKCLDQMNELQKRAFTYSYQKNFKVESLEKEALVVIDIDDLIDQYQVHVPAPPKDIADYQNQNASITKLRNAIDKYQTERYANIDEFCIHHYNYIAEFCKELREVKQEALLAEKAHNTFNPLKVMIHGFLQTRINQILHTYTNCQKLNPSITNVRNAIVKSLTKRDANIDKSCTHLDKDTAELSKEVKEVKQEAQNSNKEERCDTQANDKENEDEKKEEVAENLQENGENLVTSQNLDMPTTQDQRQDENSNKEERCNTQANEKENEDEENEEVAENLQENGENLVTSQNLDMPNNMSIVESTLFRLYENVIRNETSRMMSSIGIEAEHLFGLERSPIFFDLLDEELCHFGLAGALTDSVPNMAESTVRQNVISFFEHASDTVNGLMTLLLRCPDSKLLQQMPVQNFKSLMKSVIKSSLKAQTKGRKKLSLEGNIYIMVVQTDFERALGENISEDVLNRLRNEDEIDTRLDLIHQPSDRKEDSPIHCIYFPSDCRLFIYIPTANGSYWHRSEMQRAKRIRRHSI